MHPPGKKQQSTLMISRNIEVKNVTNEDGCKRTNCELKTCPVGHAQIFAFSYMLLLIMNICSDICDTIEIIIH